MPRTKQLSPAEIEHIMLALLSRLMVRLTGDPDHDDEAVRNFCEKLGFPYRDIRGLTYVHPPSEALN